MATKTSAKSTATKAAAAAKKTTNKVNENLGKVFDTANSVNKQVLDTTAEILNDVLQSGAAISEKITETVKGGIKFEGVSLKKVAGNINDFVYTTSEEFAENAVKTAEKWQGLGEKTLKSGLKMAAKQQDVVFDALETVKFQLGKGVDRFSKLV
ncbi:MAG: hypothetical protein AAFV80_19675, partial [Bacteroidota bacterium]